MSLAFFRNGAAKDAPDCRSESCDALAGNERMLSMSLPIANFKDLFCS